MLSIAALCRWTALAERGSEAMVFEDTIPGRYSAFIYDVRFIPGVNGADISLTWDSDTLNIKTSDRRGADPLEPMTVKMSYRNDGTGAWTCDTLLKPGSSDRMMLKFIPGTENKSRAYLLSGNTMVLSRVCGTPKGILRGYFNKNTQEPERFLLHTQPFAELDGWYSASSIDSLINAVSDSRCARWRLLDMDYDNMVFNADRSLELVTIPDANGAYDIIYAGSRYPERRTMPVGAVTGRLIPTHIPDLYRLIWRMADGTVYPIESSCSFNGALIMELFFPEQGMARIRFENTTLSALSR